jgi:hypothetical protein
LNEILGFRRVARQDKGVPVERIDVLHRPLAKFNNFNKAVHHSRFVAAILD